MKPNCLCAAIASSFALTCLAGASVVVDYTVDAGGSNPAGPSGLAASATWTISGTQLTVVLRNTSTGVPAGADVADSLLVSLGFDLVGGITITSGDSALIAPGAYGLGEWSALGAGDDVGDAWLWTNDAGGDLMEDFAQIVSTSNGQGGGVEWSFHGEMDPVVAGPFGGIAADPPLLAVPASQTAVSDAITFTLTLSGALSEADLQTVANASIVEFGSDYQYLAVPAAGSAPLLLALLLIGRRRGAGRGG
jgi:hypothetical protein